MPSREAIKAATVNAARLLDLSDEGLVDARPADSRLGWRIAGIDRQRSLQQRNGLPHALVGVGVSQCQGTQIEVIGIEALGRLAACALDLGLPQLGLDRAGDAGCDLILQIEDVVERAVEVIGPDMRAGGRVYQLERYSKSVRAVKEQYEDAQTD
jgi:hypothetical protein